MPNAPTDVALIAASGPSLTGLKAIIFDLDDTLVDARAAFEIAIDQSFRALYETITDEQSALALHLWRTDVAGHYRAYTRGELAYNEQREARLRHIAAELGLPAPTEEQVHTWVATWDAGFRAGWAAFPDVAPTLGWVEERGLATGVLTNAHADLQLEKMSATGLGQLPLLVTLDTFGVGKPDPRVFQEAARKLEVEPAEALYIGDEFDVDARAAIDAGLHGAWLRRPGHAKGGVHDADPTGAQAAGVHVLGSLAQLPQLLLQH